MLVFIKNDINAISQGIEESSRLLDAARSSRKDRHAGTAPPQAGKHVYARSLTFTVGFQISVHGRRLTVTEDRPARRSLGTGAEAHVSRWGDLFTQRGELHRARGHGNVIGFVHWLRQAARVMMGGRVGAHGYIVLL